MTDVMTLDLAEVGENFNAAKLTYERAQQAHEAAVCYRDQLIVREREVHAEAAQLGDEARRARINALDSSVNRQADAPKLAAQRRTVEQQHREMVEVIGYLSHVINPRAGVAVAEAHLAMVEAEADAYESLADARDALKVRALAQVVQLEGDLTISGGATEGVRQHVAKLRDRGILLRRYVDEARANAGRLFEQWESLERGWRK